MFAASGVDGLPPKEDMSLNLKFTNGFAMLKLPGSSAMCMEKINVEFCCNCTDYYTRNPLSVAVI